MTVFVALFQRGCCYSRDWRRQWVRWAGVALFRRARAVRRPLGLSFCRRSGEHPGIRPAELHKSQWSEIFLPTHDASHHRTQATFFSHSRWHLFTGPPTNIDVTIVGQRESIYNREFVT